MVESQWRLVLMLLASVIALAACGGAGPSDEVVALEATVVKLESTNEALEDKNVALEATVVKLESTNKPLAKDIQYAALSELDSAMKEELLALANNRDAWFLASDITTEALGA